MDGACAGLQETVGTACATMGDALVTQLLCRSVQAALATKGSIVLSSCALHWCMVALQPHSCHGHQSLHDGFGAGVLGVELRHQAWIDLGGCCALFCQGVGQLVQEGSPQSLGRLS